MLASPMITKLNNNVSKRSLVFPNVKQVDQEKSKKKTATAVILTAKQQNVGDV